MTSTARRGGAGATPPEPDGLDAMQEERDHLLRSLDDLEREYLAGDVDHTDYLTLRDDYTARAAAVIRDIEAKRSKQEPAEPPRRWGRTFAWMAAIVLFAVVAGVLVARMSGSRRDSETATGDVRESTRQLLADATNAFQRAAGGEGEWSEAIEIYGEALELSPANTEALTYRGWAHVQSGDSDAALADLDQAIEIDPDYLDARVFRAIVHAEGGRFGEAATDLQAFDERQPTQLMQQIVAQNFLRERIVAGVLLADDAPSLADSGFGAADVIAAASYVAEGGTPAEGARLLDLVLDADPGNIDARAARGWILARVGVQADDDAVTARGLADIDAALAVDPQHPEALVYRAFTLMYGFQDANGAKEALDRFDALAEKPEPLVALIDDNGLRDVINAAAGG
jgi:tetratricopeptide (TPR) repeat protein